jgi:hypothetical protein
VGSITDGVTGFFHVPTVLKSGSLKLLEPSGPVKDCNGIALPFASKPNFLPGCGTFKVKLPCA